MGPTHPFDLSLKLDLLGDWYKGRQIMTTDQRDHTVETIDLTSFGGLKRETTDTRGRVQETKIDGGSPGRNGHEGHKGPPVLSSRRGRFIGSYHPFGLQTKGE